MYKVDLLSTAVAVSVAEELNKNPELANRVRAIYQELEATAKPARPQSRRAKIDDAHLVPKGRLEGHVFGTADLYGPPDLRLMYAVYGAEQLPLALRRFTRDLLRAAAAKIEAQHPGTKPANRTRREDLIAYIVQWTVADHQG